MVYDDISKANADIYMISHRYALGVCAHEVCAVRCIETQALMQGAFESEGVASALMGEPNVNRVDIRAAVSGKTLLQLIKTSRGRMELLE